MQVRITLARSAREIEIEVDDVKAFKAEVDEVFGSEGTIWWVTDTKGNEVGIPVEQVAHVEIDQAASARQVGFG